MPKNVVQREYFREKRSALFLRHLAGPCTRGAHKVDDALQEDGSARLVTGRTPATFLPPGATRCLVEVEAARYVIQLDLMAGLLWRWSAFELADTGGDTAGMPLLVRSPAALASAGRLRLSQQSAIRSAERAIRTAAGGSDKPPASPRLAARRASAFPRLPPKLLYLFVLLLLTITAAVLVAGVVQGRGTSPPKSGLAHAALNGPPAESGSTIAAVPAKGSHVAATASELNNEGYARMRARDSTLTASELNNEGYARMRAGDYVDALPVLQRAVARLTGTGSYDEAYADFDLANTRYHLGECMDVLALLERSQQIQGELAPIGALRTGAANTCG